MRPINLIPSDERRSHGAARSGPLAYILVGGLAVILIGIVMLVLTSNQISDRESEISGLEAQKATATARAEQLAPYASFHELAEQRVETVSTLADSRFDWQRVIRQLSLILPPQVYLESLTASGGGEGTSGIAGPSLTLSGCAVGQPGVANFVASLKDIDGVTRLKLGNSTLNESEVTTTGAAACAQPGFADFEIVVAFDSAPPSPDGDEGLAVLEEAEGEGGEEAAGEGGEEAEGEASEGESESSEEGEGSSTEETASSASTTEAAG